MISDVATHDSQELGTIIDKNDSCQKLYGDGTGIITMILGKKGYPVTSYKTKASKEQKEILDPFTI